jgi:hypothetical protein
MASKAQLMNHGARVVTVHVAGEAGLATVYLAPGMNMVDGDIWKNIQESRKTNPALEAMFDKDAAATAVGPGHLEFKGMAKGDAADTAPSTTVAPGGIAPGTTPPATRSAAVDPGLTDYTAEEAKELIGDTLDRNQLEAWKRGETAGKNRTTVISALDAQIEKVSPE